MRTGDVPSLADLDRLYFQGSPVELAKAVAALPRVYALSMSELYEQVISDVRDGKAGTIHPELYRAYSENLRKAVSGYADDDLKAQFEANLSRFAAYKAWHATRQLERQLADRDGVIRSPEAFDRMARAVLNTFNRYQAAEYNTAVARARTAHQWQQFSQGDNMFLFPNLRWLPSRSANPREAHMPFNNRVWAKTDPFWQTNQPGNLWNCKCDWEETDDPVTGDNPEGIRPAKGLEGNPADTGQIFTDQCTYVQKAGKQGTKETEDFFRPIAEHHQEYLGYRNNPDYQEVDFDWGKGGVKAKHKDHKTHPNDNQRYFPEQLTGDQLEQEFMDKAFALGHSVVFKAEAANVTDLDMYLDGKLMDLISPTENSTHYRNPLGRKNHQLKKYNDLHEEGNGSICMYFHDPTFYSIDKVERGLQEVRRWTDRVDIRKIYILKNDGSDIIELDFP